MRFEPRAPRRIPSRKADSPNTVRGDRGFADGAPGRAVRDGGVHAHRRPHRGADRRRPAPRRGGGAPPVMLASHFLSSTTRRAVWSIRHDMYMRLLPTLGLENLREAFGRRYELEVLVQDAVVCASATRPTRNAHATSRHVLRRGTQTHAALPLRPGSSEIRSVAPAAMVAARVKSAANDAGGRSPSGSIMRRSAYRRAERCGSASDLRAPATRRPCRAHPGSNTTSRAS